MLAVPAKVQSLGIVFAAPDYINGENYEYSYQLSNYNSSWIELQKSNKITFMNLPHGDYLLKVRYRNDVVDSHAKEYTLPIKILPPLYLSPLAIFTYLFLGLILILLFSYRIYVQIQKKQQRLADKIQKEQKEKLYESKLDFFTHITHELCTPLTLIKGVEHYIRSYASHKQDPKLEKYAGILRENADELNGLIQEILDFRKAEDAGFSHASIHNISISALLQTQFERFDPLAERHHIRFQIDTPQISYWNTDPVFLKKILTNLISNAFKYTEEGGYIHISSTSDHQNLIIKVYNTGQGIKEEDQPYIFDRYRILETMKKDKDTNGMIRNGLGLFICHSLAQTLHGTIDIRSEVGEYAEFTVTLPWLEETKERVEDAPIPMPAPAPVSEEEKATLLVIDDHKDIVWLISEALTPHYKIHAAYTAEEALDYMKRESPALIITDIMMPQMDGLALIAHIKDNKFTRHIPQIIVSAKISDQEQAIGLDIGADAYLTKPFSPAVLLSVVNRLLTSQRELRDYFYSPESAIQYTDGQLMHQEDKEFMDTVSNIIKENIGKEGLGPEFIADTLHLNTRALYRRFKKISSLTPSDFIKDYRLSYAAQLLVNTNMSIQEIIYNVGVSNKSYFYREFARKYEMTPKEFRKKV